MKKIISTVAAILFGATLVFADGTITGEVSYKESGEAIDFAMVQLIDARTGKPTTIGTNTDEKGQFILAKVPNGKYIVRISNLGNIPQEREVTINNGVVNIGSIHLADDTKMLEEVEVTGMRSQMRFELDRRVFTVDADIASAGASASELLESIPSVEVDQEGEVSLRGNSSVTVWINGKESGLTAENRAQILEQIPGDTIERIEVITNPSAKYSPEGTAGIINIVLKKDRRGGYFGSAEIGANTQGGGNVGVNINYNTSKWDTYASIGFRMRHNKGGGITNRKYTDDTYLNSESQSKNHGNNIFARLGATYHLTDKDNFYVNGFFMKGHPWGNSTTNYLSNLPNQWVSNVIKSSNKNHMLGLNGEIGYIHKWTETHTLDMMVAYHNWGGPRWSSYEQTQEYEDGSIDNIYQEQDMEMSSSSWEAKVDYTNHLTDWLKLEAGFDGRYSYEDSPVETMQGTSSTDMILNEDLYNQFIYRNNVSALYATLGGKFKSFSFSAGLRSESWQVRARSLGYGQTIEDVKEYKHNDFALFPSAFVSWSLPKNNELQVNFTRRIRRPWGGQLNSFKNISDPTNISYGNEALQPQYSNAFELNYIKSWTSHMISFSGYLRTSEDVMERISYIASDGIMYTTTANTGNSLSAGTEIVVKNSLFRNRLDLTTTANLYHYHLDAWDIMFDHEGTEIPVSGKKQNSFAWDIRCMASLRLPWDISFQATGRYNSRRISAQGTREPGWSVDAGLRKSLGNWSFAINWRDIFNSRKMHRTTIGPEYTQEMERWRGGTNIRFTIKYSFGNMKAKRPDKPMMESEMMDPSEFESGGMQ